MAPTIWQLLADRAASDPDRPAFLDDRGRRLTFRELHDTAERAAAGLLARGVEPGTPVSWQLPTRLETVVLSLALSRLGAVQNPIIPIYGAREVRAMLRQTGSRLLVVPEPWRGVDYPAMAAELAAELAAESMQPLDALVLDGPLPEGDPRHLPPPPQDAEAITWVYATSGTTSEPKGVLHCDTSLIAGGMGLGGAYEVTAEDIGSITYPYAHIGGADSLVIGLTTGSAHLLVETFDPPRTVALQREVGVTMAGGSTAFYLAYLAEQAKDPGTPVIPTLRALNGGGAPMPPDVYWRVRRELGIPVFHGYGMTECPSIASGGPADTDEQLAGTEGRPVPGIEVVVAGADGRPVAPGEEGDIWVRGPMVCSGYTDESVTATSFKAGGFLDTGDRGYLRPDGHLRLTGRTKDLIIRKGENISPREVEDVVQAHPRVAAVAVIGLPDAERGERVCAVVEVVAGQAALSFTELQQHCAEAGLSRRKFPEQLEVVDALPRNATMKVLKTELRKRYG